MPQGISMLLITLAALSSVAGTYKHFPPILPFHLLSEYERCMRWLPQEKAYHFAEHKVITSKNFAEQNCSVWRMKRQLILDPHWHRQHVEHLRLAWTPTTTILSGQAAAFCHFRKERHPLLGTCVIMPGFPYIHSCHPDLYAGTKYTQAAVL